mmetsp:Transcript_68637/g.213110  ORF Transcript_68637/g.213110 Transcript_68637/m.213110 type:complete len:219 (+) Transcript_68637:405-1061(+)
MRPERAGGRELLLPDGSVPLDRGLELREDRQRQVSVLHVRHELGRRPRAGRRCGPGGGNSLPRPRSGWAAQLGAAGRAAGHECRRLRRAGSVPFSAAGGAGPAALPRGRGRQHAGHVRAGRHGAGLDCGRARAGPLRDQGRVPPQRHGPHEAALAERVRHRRQRRDLRLRQDCELHRDRNHPLHERAGVQVAVRGGRVRAGLLSSGTGGQWRRLVGHL